MFFEVSVCLDEMLPIVLVLFIIQQQVYFLRSHLSRNKQQLFCRDFFCFPLNAFPTHCTSNQIFVLVLLVNSLVSALSMAGCSFIIRKIMNKSTFTNAHHSVVVLLCDHLDHFEFFTSTFSIHHQQLADKDLTSFSIRKK